MKRAALIALVFLLGAAVGFFLSDRRERGDPSPPSEGVTGGAASVAPESDPRDASALLDSVLRALPPVPRAEGGGVISGRVRLESGASLPGVAVVASRSRPGFGGPLTPEHGVDLKTEILQFIEERRIAEATRRETRTGEDGSFRIPELTPGSYLVRAALDGYEIEPASGDARETVRPGETIDFLARAIVPITVEVLLPDGTEADRARLIFTTRSDEVPESFEITWTREAPALSLEPGLYGVVAIRGEAERTAPRNFVLRLGDARSRLVLRLESHLSIRGSVVFLPGEEVERVGVFPLRWSAERAPVFEDFIAAGDGQTARREEGYTFAFEDLPPGRYFLATGRGWRRLEVVEEVALRDEPVTLNLVVPPLDPDAYVLLWVLGPSDEVLTELLEIETRCRTGRRISSHKSTYVQRPDGAYIVLNPRDRACDAEDVTQEISVTSPRFGTKSIEYKLPREEPLYLRFPEPAVLEVDLTGYEGSGLEGWLQLDLRDAPEGRRHGRGKEIDFGGRKTFDPVEPGNWELVFTVKTHIGRGSYGAQQVSRAEITLEAGVNRLTLPVPQLYSLAVEVGADKARSTINLRQLADGGGYTGVQHNEERIDDDGRVVFHRIPAGRYELSSGRGPRDGGAMTIEVTGDSTVRYAPR